MCLRAGKSLNRPLDGSEATKKKIAEAWEGPESILEHMWSQNSESYDLLSSNSMVYHACCNGGGLHLGNGLQKWSWQGWDTRIEILCKTVAAQKVKEEEEKKAAKVKAQLEAKAAADAVAAAEMTAKAEVSKYKKRRERASRVMEAL